MIGGLSMRLYHTTDAAAAILAGGFGDHENSYVHAGVTRRGVLLARWPADEPDGSASAEVLEVTLPDDLDLSPWAIAEDGTPAWQWCLPAELIDATAGVRLLGDADVAELRQDHAWHAFAARREPPGFVWPLLGAS